MPTSVSYTIYRKTTVVEGLHENGVADGFESTPISALIRMGVQSANGPKSALQAWFTKLPLEDQVKMNGAAKFVVVPTSNHHELAPRVEAQPRLVF